MLEPNIGTLRYEFRGSIVVFASVLALGKAHDQFRLAGLLTGVAHLVAIGQWDISLLFVGCSVASSISNTTHVCRGGLMLLKSTPFLLAVSNVQNRRGAKCSP